MDLTLKAELHQGQAAEPCTAEVLDFAGMAKQAADWDSLLSEAAYPNPFHSHGALAAHTRAGLAGPGVRFVAVRRGTELVAVLPFRAGAGRVGLRRCHLVWTHSAVSINGTPLLHRNGLPQTANVLLDGMAAIRGTRLWRFPLLAITSASGQTLLTEARRRGWPVEIVSSFGRAVLDRRLDYETYASHHMSGSRRKGLRRQRRRLAELGRLAFESCTDDGELADAVEAFLALEAQGWKGTRGTALASSPANAELARVLFTSATSPVASRADLLRLDGRPIAISLALVCRGRAFLLKTAYDERLRAYAPGLLLEDAIIRCFHQTRFADRLDSASLAGCVLEDFFPDREPIGEVVLATDASVTAATLSHIVAQERVRLGALAQLKRWYWRVVDF